MSRPYSPPCRVTGNACVYEDCTDGVGPPRTRCVHCLWGPRSPACSGAEVIDIAKHRPRQICGDGCVWVLPMNFEATYEGNAKIGLTFVCPSCGDTHSLDFGGNEK